ncbi:MAG: hypothetical protein A3C92_01240 [Candidatus Sungbacteria bacterium RIFCSPHIGHO2_02_FULL_53_17]|uniref:histidine kinase n=1 Tax=Candidatus Sungbacteria bacterium RIFCSPHIGHO2_02_FULL_53_17 TaxID=1802275 RepID=A0A1G2KVX7_9BACT|nr:MAG: hypothetical protein A3C92_01240 [Candidatus Sungbacteria bacterium RIFCSPHIGHO2_02_FULL_53_17]
MNWSLQNLDLFSVGVAIASTGILGFVVFLNNRKSITNKTFLGFCVVTILWGIANYLHYQTHNPLFALWSLRMVFFFAVLQSFAIFQLFYVFAAERVFFSKKYIFGLVPVVLLTALMTLTPLVSSEVTGFSPAGVPENTKGPGLILFGLVSMGLVGGALYILLRKLMRGSREEREQLEMMLVGTLLMFGLIIPLNFILPAFFENFTFLPLSAVFTFPFAVLSAYAVLRHHIFGSKVIATEVLAFILAVVTLFEVLATQGFSELIFRIAIFVLVFIFSIFLIRSVRREVEQREELGRLNERLKELDVLKSEFVGMAGHQLRGPLTIIKGYVSLMLEGTIDGISAGAKEALGKVQFSTDQLIKLVASLLDLSRIESGRIKYEYAAHDFSAMVTEVIDKFKASAEKKGVVLVFENKLGSASFVFDADKLREAVVNYVDNAVKYTDTGEVRVTLSPMQGPDGKWARLEVRDSGMGIKKEDIWKLFGKFSRTEEAKQHDPNGMGIGIYFAKRVIQDHGGNVGAHSEGINKGSTFWMELPMNVRG